MQRALSVDVQEIAVFTAASETFSQKNTNCCIEDSIQRIESILKTAKVNNLRVRAYISCVLGCPYEGKIDVKQVVSIAKRLYDMGCYEISLGDTIGIGTAVHAQELYIKTTKVIPKGKIAIHFHDTRGQALANIFACLELGASIIDTSVSGLGGCPYAPGATGNVATEDVVYMLNGLDIETGIDINKLLETGAYINNVLNRQPASRLGQVALKEILA